MMHSLTRVILESIFGKDRLKFSTPVVGVIKSNGHSRKLSYRLCIPGVTPSDLTKTFWRLRQKKFIDFKEDKEGQVRIVLFEAGQRKVLSYKLDDLAIVKPKKWDGKWHIVAFDIPENKKVARNALSRKMKELGLMPFQKSLWLYPYNCKDEIDFIAEIFEVGKYVHYIVTHSITNDQLLRQKFGI